MQIEVWHHSLCLKVIAGKIARSIFFDKFIVDKKMLILVAISDSFDKSGNQKWDSDLIILLLQLFKEKSE